MVFCQADRGICFGEPDRNTSGQNDKKQTLDYYKLKEDEMEIVNLEQKFQLFTELWSPKIVGELNGQQVKLVKFKGAFVWHKHDHEDELFFVVKGSFRMEYRDRTVIVNENEFLIVPKGIEHKPVADDEVWVMLFEPATTLNSGDTENELTKHVLDSIKKECTKHFSKITERRIFYRNDIPLGTSKLSEPGNYKTKKMI